MPRKKRIDSTEEAVRYASAVAIRPPATVPLNKDQLPLFLSIIDERPKADWTAEQVETAAMLALVKSQAISMRIDSMSEPPVVVGAAGGPVPNPIFGVVARLDETVIKYRRQLGLHARAQGEARDVGKRTARGLEAESNASSPMGDDLLARPQ